MLPVINTRCLFTPLATIHQCTGVSIIFKPPRGGDRIMLSFPYSFYFSPIKHSAAKAMHLIQNDLHLTKVITSLALRNSTSILTVWVMETILQLSMSTLTFVKLTRSSVQREKSLVIDVHVQKSLSKKKNMTLKLRLNQLNERGNMVSQWCNCNLFFFY